MNNQLLLLEDVDALGRSGDIVKVRPGYARNFLLPQKKAIIATGQTLKLQEDLKRKRIERASEDRKAAEQLAKQLEGKVLTTHVKIDQDGHMYGSVTALDLARLCQKEGLDIERRHIILPQPIKMLGVYDIHLKLKEGVPAMIALEVLAEEPEGL